MLASSAVAGHSPRPAASVLLGMWREAMTVFVRQAGGVTELDASARRVERLRLELDDEGIRLRADGALLAMVLAELDYARHPHAHEGVAPRYGALLSSIEVLTAQRVGSIEHVDVGDVPISVVRRVADGRSSFVARTVAGPTPHRSISLRGTRPLVLGSQRECDAVHRECRRDLGVAVGVSFIGRCERSGRPAR
jgi:hypothetical protein